MGCRAAIVLTLGIIASGTAFAQGEPSSTGSAAGANASKDAAALPKPTGAIIGGAGILGGFVTLVDDGDDGTSTSTSTSTSTATATTP